MRRRGFLASTLSIPLLGLMRNARGQTHVVTETQLGRGKHSDAVWQIGSQKQLFIDDRLIADSQGIERVVNPPLSTQIINMPPLNGLDYNANMTALEIDGRCRLYYAAQLPTGAEKGQQQFMTCLSYSDNGIDWQHPDIGLFSINSSKKNNVVMPSAAGTVFIDPKKTQGSPLWYLGIMSERTAPPFWKETENTYYRTLYDDAGHYYHEGGVYVAHSADGIKWHRLKEPALPFWCDTQNQCFYDSRIDKYVAYLRGNNSPRMAKRRNVRRTETESLVDLPWPYDENPERKRGPAGLYGDLIDELPEVMGPDGLDPEATDLYTPCVHLYPWAQDVYLAFPAAYRHYDGQDSYGRDLRGTVRNSGPLEVQLAVSRDGIEFHRFRKPYLSPGLLEEDRGGGAMFMGVGMIRRRHYIYQYFQEFAHPHGNPVFPDRKNALDKRFGVAIHRLDGFVSMDAGPSEGELVTPPIVFQGNKLELNIDCRAMGETWVEIQDVVGRPIQGYAMQESVSVDRNGIAQEVWWQNGPSVSALAGKPIRLNVKMRSSKLYGFQFVK